MKAKIIIKANLKDGIIENKVKMLGDENIMINSLLDALITTCKENDVDLKKITKYIKDYDKYLIKEGNDDLLTQ